jgi:hypothetical protein
MFLGLDGNQWLQLWGGTVGAFVAAVIGGIVALVVVNLANRHQSQISERQLRQQAAEASRARENKVIAELIVASYDLLDAVYISNEALEAVRRRMSAAVIAWNLEANNPALFAMVREWPHWLLNWAKLARDHPTSAQRAEANGEVRWKTGQFIRSIEAWPNATEDERLAILEGDLKLPGPGMVVLPADPIPRSERSPEDTHFPMHVSE